MTKHTLNEQLLFEDNRIAQIQADLINQSAERRDKFILEKLSIETILELQKQIIEELNKRNEFTEDSKSWRPKEDEYVWLVSDGGAYPVLRKFNNRLLEDINYMDKECYEGKRTIKKFIGEVP